SVQSFLQWVGPFPKEIEAIYGYKFQAVLNGNTH
ncbi:unnamed protein product, partial [marine sediment metagenome]